MQIKVLTVPLSDNQTQLADLNSFLATNKIIDVQQEFVACGNDSFWSYCIRFVGGGVVNNSKNDGGFVGRVAKDKIDYKLVLSEAHFENFAKLRVIRKQIADDDAVPPYVILTDAEMAKVAQIEEPLSEINLKAIEGIGAKKIEKYAAKLISMYNETPTPFD